MMLIQNTLTTSPPDVSHSISMELEARSSELWECVARTRGKHGGYIYRFRLKDEYDGVTTKDPARTEASIKRLIEIIPANEPNALFGLLLDPNVSVEQIFELMPIDPGMRGELDELKTLVKTLWLLGYNGSRQADGIYLEAPDREALLGSWEELRKTKPELPELTIEACDDMVTDVKFVQSYLQFDALLSRDGFLHDHFSHLIFVIRLMLESNVGGNPSYHEERNRLRAIVSGVYQRVEAAQKRIEEDELVKKHLDKVTALVAIQTDLISSLVDYPAIKNVTEKEFSVQRLVGGWIRPLWQKYWIDRFGMHPHDNCGEIKSVLNKIEKWGAVVC